MMNKTKSIIWITLVLSLSLLSACVAKKGKSAAELDQRDFPTPLKGKSLLYFYVKKYNLDSKQRRLRMYVNNAETGELIDKSYYYRHMIPGKKTITAKLFIRGRKQPVLRKLTISTKPDKSYFIQIKIRKIGDNYYQPTIMLQAEATAESDLYNLREIIRYGPNNKNLNW